ncbi:putative major facilitator superfamily transporter [Caenibius tardaugens NBRC 16725]|uniref:Putative major facilitator superfamily transporter n=1 Tax=Caenibius tardaugens NBRC 16725 TaxID=1219035 RepID=U3A484_9SPHN|nr:MFS transporter [Caenibius tardaugens]AZI37853.1 MFS transporter [Caenibius tardaugens NBRC 16725]GAD49568.1 putative major facilitator superfamily transporter [Caenibius tardaugens NBRC 16725]
MASSVAPAAVEQENESDVRLVIAASSAGTIFEWYDFFIYGTLYAVISKAFFPADNPTLSVLLTWATFAIGFGFRPIGAILFGYLGDRLGRKYTFLVTVTLMGIATAGVGLVPDAESIGLAAPLLVIFLRILQGLALGGEYGGAATYVAEHAPPDRRGFYTSFIQGSVVGGFVLSISVVLLCRLFIPEDAFSDWGWRLPFLLSIILLAISLWMRFKLSESPVFKAMKEAGETSQNPFIESFTYPGNKKRIFVALFGITAGLTTIWYTAFFTSLSFLRGPMRVDGLTVELILFVAGFITMFLYLPVGKWSDRVGRKKPIIIGNFLTLILLFPAFWMMGNLANPGIWTAAEANPVQVEGPACSTDPFGDLSGTRASPCGRVLETLVASGVPYTIVKGDTLRLTAGGQDIALPEAWMNDNAARKVGIETALAARGFDFSVQQPSWPRALGIVAILVVLGALSALTFGSAAALLAELFPARIRYSSMSIPYHIGAGYFGGFLPLIANYIVAKSGDAYAGLWYTWLFVLVSLLVGLWGIPSGPPQDFTEDVA